MIFIGATGGIIFIVWMIWATKQTQKSLNDNREATKRRIERMQLINELKKRLN